jgi:ATP-binding cassette subfamily B protein
LSFSFLLPVQDVLLPHYYGNLIESLSSNKDIFKNVVIVLVIFVCLELGFIFSDWRDIKTSSGFQTFARQEILKDIMNKYEKNFSDLYLGSIMSKIVKIPYTLVVWYERMKYHIIPFILVFGFAICYFGCYDTMLGFALLITAIVYTGIILGVPSYICRKLSEEKDKVINEIHEEIDDTLRNFIAMHGNPTRQKEEIERLHSYETLFTQKFAETTSCLMKTNVYTSIIEVIMTLLTFTIIFILRSYALLQKKKLTAASFSSMFLILVYVTNTMLMVEGHLREMIFDWGAIFESDDLFNKGTRGQTPSCENRTGGNMPILQEPGVGMQHVAFTFLGKGRQILSDINFHIKKGETVIILGDIGSGKSTILKLLLKFNEPDSGVIYIDGKNYCEMTLEELKKKVGYVPQQPILFNRTVLQNILYGTSGVTKEQVERFIKEIGVDKEFVNLEKGLDAKIGKNGFRLSGGQRQIVWCLRTFFQNPDIIVMDKPTASLDTKSTELLKMILGKIMKEKTVIIVTHDKSLLEMADRKLQVVDGKFTGNSDTSNKSNSAFQMLRSSLDK